MKLLTTELLTTDSEVEDRLRLSSPERDDSHELNCVSLTLAVPRTFTGAPLTATEDSDPASCQVPCNPEIRLSRRIG